MELLFWATSKFREICISIVNMEYGKAKFSNFSESKLQYKPEFQTLAEPWKMHSHLCEASNSLKTIHSRLRDRKLLEKNLNFHAQSAVSKQ